MNWEILMAGGLVTWMDILFKGEVELNLEEHKKIMEEVFAFLVGTDSDLVTPGIMGLVMDEAVKIRKGKYRWHQYGDENCGCLRCNTRMERELGGGNNANHL